jgi:hypothetical protein
VPKIDKLKDLHLKYRLQRKKDEVGYLSTLIAEIERNMKRNRDHTTIEDIERGIFKQYYADLIKTGSADSIKELKFLRDENIIDNMMNIQEIDLNLRAIYAKKAEEDPNFVKDSNSRKHQEVLTEFVKNFVPTVADFQSVKERQKKIFNL